MSVDQRDDFVKRLGVTEDGFLGGRLRVSQPRHGFRAGLDSVLLGASVTPGSGPLLDLGAGVGTAGLVALFHDPGLNAVFVERDAEPAGLAELNIVQNDLEVRARLVRADLGDMGAIEGAGLAAESFGTVIANPPYFVHGAGTRAAMGRDDARHGPRDLINMWVRRAAGMARPGGEAIFVHRAEALGDLLDAFGTRFGGVRVLPLHPRAGEPANLFLIRGTKGSRAKLQLEHGLVLHAAAGNGFMTRIDDVLTGRARLDW